MTTTPLEILIYRGGATPNDYLYGGEQFDANLGFYYLRTRYMNPESGRFFSADSFAGNADDPVSLHKYLYADADPIDRNQSRGQACDFCDLETRDLAAEIGRTIPDRQRLRIAKIAGLTPIWYQFGTVPTRTFVTSGVDIRADC
jgi:RHS repeat-associated protein